MANYNIELALARLIDISARPINTNRDAVGLAYELKLFLKEQENEAFERGYKAALDAQIPIEI